MASLYFLLFCTLFLASPPSDYRSNQNKLNILTFTNEQKRSFFPILQWCSLIRIYSLFPSFNVKNNFVKTFHKTDLCYLKIFFRTTQHNSKPSFISERDDILASKTVEDLIIEAIEHLSCSQYINNMLFHYRGNVKTSKLIGILLNRITINLTEINGMSNDFDKEKMENIVNFFTKNSEFSEILDIEAMIDEYVSLNHSKDRNKNTMPMDTQQLKQQKLIYDFMNGIVFIFEKMFDFALNENINVRTDQSFVCLKLFGDCNLLIHLFLLLINRKNTETFYYFVFKMDTAVEKILNYFYSLEFNSKLYMLLDNTKTYYKVTQSIDEQAEEIQCPISLEFFKNFSKQQFFENLANALTLASIEPFYWEPPNIKDETFSFFFPEFFVV